MGADVAGEDRTAVHADAQSRGGVAVLDLAQRLEHALLVVAERTRHARDEDDLAAVVVDIRPEERDVVRVGRALHVDDELFDRGRERAGALVLEHRVGAVEVEERDRGVAVLRVLATGEEVGADRGGDEAGEVDASARSR